MSKVMRLPRWSGRTRSSAKVVAASVMNLLSPVAAASKAAPSKIGPAGRPALKAALTASLAWPLGKVPRVTSLSGKVLSANVVVTNRDSP